MKPSSIALANATSWRRSATAATWTQPDRALAQGSGSTPDRLGESTPHHRGNPGPGGHSAHQRLQPVPHPKTLGVWKARVRRWHQVGPLRTESAVGVSHSLRRLWWHWLLSRIG